MKLRNKLNYNFWQRDDLQAYINISIPLFGLFLKSEYIIGMN